MTQNRTKLETFFKLVFGKSGGYICIASRKGTSMQESFFKYPDELPDLVDHVNNQYLEYDVYFCPQPLLRKKRRKDNVMDCPNIWADIDTGDPGTLLVPPTILVETSDGRYQGLWILDRSIEATSAEDIARRIAYFHSESGVDRSGWDLTQLLRVPYTYNYKYEPPEDVRVVDATTARYRVSDFDAYPQAEGFEYLEIPFPSAAELENLDAKTILEAYRKELNPRVWSLFYETPQQKSWSEPLWQLELSLYESGLSRNEVFVVANESACNKYRRDNRDIRLLWKEVCRAEAHVNSIDDQLIGSKKIELGKLLDEEEVGKVESEPTLIEEYVEWAKTLGDAAWQYHQVGAFCILSALLSGSVRLPTSYGILVPNLWFLILADTTLTRKTTAMDIAMDMILDIDSDCVLATDGSIEGLFTSLSTRPGRASIFLRDEFSGLLEAMTRKDYMAGMAETLTKMYDGKYQKRVLRREIIEVRDPVLIIFAGGIRTRIYELLRYEHVASGFVPRFVFVSADSDITKLRPLGPPTDRTSDKRDVILKKLRALHDRYHAVQEIKIGDKVTHTQIRWDARLTEDAWIRYNKFEADMVATGLESPQAEIMTPTFDRLSKSGLKMAILLAAARTTEGEVVVTKQDILHAIYYIQQWGVYTLDLIYNIGKSASERQLEQVYRAVVRTPGIGRSQLMQNHHLTSREATLVFDTLEQRGLIRKEKRGRGEYFTAVD